MASAEPSSIPRATDLGFPVFLTAYDPSDLPGGSVDPLGFERGYLFLADRILPGLTNVADRPRYFSVLCAGALLADIDIAAPPRLQYRRRLDCILRFERFWSLANVLASQQRPESELPVSGIRGVSYATAKAESLLRTRARRVDANFKMLSRQVPYGVVGTYGAVADGMRFLDRSTFTLTPDLGERIAEGFIEQTDMPSMLVKAVRDDGDMPITRLTEWGERAHIAAEALPVERDCLADALHRDPVRSRMSNVLARHPFQDARDTEMQRLKRLLPALSSDIFNQDLHQAVLAILAFEACYQWVMLGFERLLWLCRMLPAGAVSPSDLNSDSVLQFVCDQLPAASRRLDDVLNAAQTSQAGLEMNRIEDTRRFLECVSAACSTPESLARELMGRHGDVQRGKFDRGRKKMPWLEMTNGQISLTMTRVGGLNIEATLPSDITPHPYRLASADALIAAAGAQ